MNVGSLGSAGDYSALARLINDNNGIHARLDALNSQISSGIKSQTYAGLGHDAVISLNLHPQIARLQTWQDNIDAATGRMAIAQTSLTQLQQITTTFISATNNLNGISPTGIDSTAAQARDALLQVTNLLNAQDGSGAYVFAGQDTANPPIPNPDGITSSPFFQQIQSAVGQLSTFGGAGVAASTLATASSNAAGTSPFSTYLSQPVSNLPAPTIQVGEHQTVAIGLFASGNSLVPSTGTSTTGSYMRDLMRGLATIASLSSSQAGDPNLQTLIQDTRTSLQGALTAMANEAGVMGDRQSDLGTLKTNLGDTSDALTTQVGTAEDTDMASALSKLAATQTQLQASYQLIASVTSLSLAKFLPAA
jgi:flagellin-like hook-associated protein FlgL